jgi:hypothetical protein
MKLVRAVAMALEFRNWMINLPSNMIGAINEDPCWAGPNMLSVEVRSLHCCCLGKHCFVCRHCDTTAE